MIKLTNLLREAYVSEDMLKQLATEMGETIKQFLGTGAIKRLFRPRQINAHGAAQKEISVQISER